MTFREAISLIAHSAPLMEGSPTPEMKEAARIFAQATLQANERLSRCESLLLAHQRSEAIRLAAIEPNLLDYCRDLDVATRPTWTYYCTNHGLTVPVELNRVASRTLNAAYATEMAHEKELQHHRMLALVRAPLKQRLDALRVLAVAEPNNIGWREDLVAHEASRLDEIRQEYRDARTKKDKDRMDLLLREINTPNLWKTPIPLDLLADISKFADEARDKEIASAVRRLKERLDAAIRHGLLDDAIAAEDDIPKVQQLYNLPDGHPSLSPLQAGIDWIDRETKKRKKLKLYDKACADLRQAISHHFEWASVQQHYEHVVSFSLPIPDDIERHYRGRLQRLWIYRIVGIAAGVLLLMAIVLWLVLKK